MINNKLTLDSKEASKVNSLLNSALTIFKNADIEKNKGNYIDEGDDAVVYEWGNDCVLKVMKGGSPEKFYEDELKVGLALLNHKVRSPKIIGTVENQRAIVYERIYGNPLMKKVLSQPWTLFKCARAMAELHLSIHKNTGEGLKSFKELIAGCIETSVLLSSQNKNKILNILNKLPDSNTLCHGDIHPKNVIMSPNGPVAIDWTRGSYGHPLLDVARTATLLKYAGDPEKRSFFETTLVNLFRKVFYNEYINHYFKISGTDITLEELEIWELPVAAARQGSWNSVSDKEMEVYIQKLLKKY